MGCTCSSKQLDEVAEPRQVIKIPRTGRQSANASSTSALSDARLGGEGHLVGPDGRTQLPPGSVEAILARGAHVHKLRILPWDERDEDLVSNFGLPPPTLEGDAAAEPPASVTQFAAGDGAGSASAAQPSPSAVGEAVLLRSSSGSSKPAIGSSSNNKHGYCDEDGPLTLSSRQRDLLHQWRRMPDVISSKTGAKQPVVMASAPSSEPIRQGLVGDCSFLSALSVLAEYERKFRMPVLSSIIYPQVDTGDGPWPAYNEYGKYGCRLFLNGMARKVVVDDTVPVRRDGRLLCAHSSCSHELWVTLLEKAFAKLTGSSYDMQGSNPGTDVFHLTGWVPETVVLNGAASGSAGSSVPSSSGGASPGRGGASSFSSWDEVFDSACTGLAAGTCVVCVGTSELADAVPDKEARRMGHIEGVSVSTGLVAHHAYPVLDVQKIGGQRLLHLKNPWGRIRWRGRFAPGDRSWTEVAAAAGLDLEGLKERLGRSSIEAATDDGHFWIPWEEVLRHFSHLYFCWVPSALKLNRLEVHARWDPEPHFSKSRLPDDTHITAFNPQFVVQLEEPIARDGRDAVIWVLLSRHVHDRADTTSKYVAVHAHRANSRLSCPDAPLEQGVYSNGECALVKVHGDALRGDREFVVIVSQHGHKDVFNFTLQVYSPVPAKLRTLPPLVPPGHVSGSVEGKWTRETAGGSGNDLWQYFRNPQWRIDVPEGGAEVLTLFLECPAELSVNVRLFQGAAARPEALRRAHTSGPYRQGCCVLRLTNLAAGQYVAVVSAFHAGSLADFRLAWHSSCKLQLQPNPHPFGSSVATPLASCVQSVSIGKELSLGLTPATSASRTHVSIRLQFKTKDGRPPSLQLFVESNEVETKPAPDCVWLVQGQAADYFTAFGAAVLVGVPLLYGTRYKLTIKPPLGTAAAEVALGEATLHVFSDNPVILGEDGSGPPDSPHLSSLQLVEGQPMWPPASGWELQELSVAGQVSNPP